MKFICILPTRAKRHVDTFGKLRQWPDSFFIYSSNSELVLLVQPDPLDNCADCLSSCNSQFQHWLDITIICSAVMDEVMSDSGSAVISRCRPLYRHFSTNDSLHYGTIGFARNLNNCKKITRFEIKLFTEWATLKRMLCYCWISCLNTSPYTSISLRSYM